MNTETKQSAEIETANTWTGDQPVAIVVSDKFSDHGLPVGATVARCAAPEWVALGDDGDWYSRGGEGDEVAIDPRDLSAAAERAHSPGSQRNKED